MDQGELKISDAIDYNSHNTTRLNLLEMQEMLMKLQFIQSMMDEERVVVEE